VVVVVAVVVWRRSETVSVEAANLSAAVRHSPLGLDAQGPGSCEALALAPKRPAAAGGTPVRTAPGLPVAGRHSSAREKQRGGGPEWCVLN
jgi:hypothetical protein